MNKLCFVLFSAFLLMLPLYTVHAQTEAFPEIEEWLSLPDRSVLFEKQSEMIPFVDRNSGREHVIIIDDRQQMQTIDGFGFALTGGSAEHLINMSKSARQEILQEMFATDGDNVGFSYIRLTIGASDLNSFVFSYNDLPEGESDFELNTFSLSQDLKDVVPVMKEILEINPDILILGSPWSAPAWMKTHFDVRGGQLREDCYDVYGRYFVKYVQAMAAEGITIDAITIQNEPLNSRNTPSMFWLAYQQKNFIKNNLGPALRAAGLNTKIFAFDHNLDRPDYPLSILNDPDAAQYVDGSAFHHYAGDISAMTDVYMARPDKNIYFTEQLIRERSIGSPEMDIAGNVKRMIVDITRHWSRNVILWNLAADPDHDPHTDNGGCSICQGAIAIDGDMVERNVAYYTIAHASKFVRPGSVRIASTAPGDRSTMLFEDEQRPDVFRNLPIIAEVLPNVAFKTPDGKIVLVVVNNTHKPQRCKVQHNGLFATIEIASGAVGTYVW